MLSLADSLFVALWGWSGLFLVLLAAWQVADWAFSLKPLISGRAKTLIAGAILAFGLASAWHEFSLAKSATTAVEREADRARLWSASVTDAERRKAEALWRELP